VSREAGLTLIEIAVVLAIVAIVAFATITALGRAQEETRTKGVAEQVATAIQQTRSLAVMHVATYELTFPGNSQVQISCIVNCDVNSPQEGPTPLVHELTVTPPGTPIQFTSMGASNGGTVIVNPGVDQRTVTVTLAGRVQVTPP
jgi:prepilin-type N-terminal cleavage/methylation domain-containing protein